MLQVQQLAERRAANGRCLRVYSIPLDETMLTGKLVAVGLLDASQIDDHAAVEQAAARFFAAVLALAE